MNLKWWQNFVGKDKLTRLTKLKWGNCCSMTDEVNFGLARSIWSEFIELDRWYRRMNHWDSCYKLKLTWFKYPVRGDEFVWRHRNEITARCFYEGNLRVVRFHVAQCPLSATRIIKLHTFVVFIVNENEKNKTTEHCSITQCCASHATSIKLISEIVNGDQRSSTRPRRSLWAQQSYDIGAQLSSGTVDV